jgi:hypothetical protein
MSTLNEWLYSIDRTGPPISGTASCLMKVVAFELILHYTLNMDRHFQRYL